MHSPKSKQNLCKKLFGYENISQYQSSEDIQKLYLSISKFLETRKPDWKERQSALHLLGILSTESISLPQQNSFLNYLLFKNSEIIKNISIAFVEQIKDNRSEITKQASYAIQSYAVFYKRRFLKISRRILPMLLQNIGRSNETIRGHFRQAIVQILQNIHHPTLMKVVFSAFYETKVSIIQENCVAFVSVILAYWNISSLMKNENKIIEAFLRDCLKGKTTDIRHIAGRCFWFYAYHFPDRHHPFLATVHPRSRSIIIDEEIEMDEIECIVKQNYIKVTSIPALETNVTLNSTPMKKRKPPFVRNISTENVNISPVYACHSPSHQSLSPLSASMTRNISHLRVKAQYHKKHKTNVNSCATMPMSTSNKMIRNRKAVVGGRAKHPQSAKVSKGNRNMGRNNNSIVSQKSPTVDFPDIDMDSEIESVFHVNFDDFQPSIITQNTIKMFQKLQTDGNSNEVSKNEIEEELKEEKSNRKKIQSMIGDENNMLNISFAPIASLSPDISIVSDDKCEERNLIEMRTSDIENATLKELQTEYHFFESQMHDSLQITNEMMGDFSTVDKEKIKKVIHVLEKQKQTLEFALIRFKTYLQ